MPRPMSTQCLESADHGQGFHSLPQTLADQTSEMERQFLTSSPLVTHVA